ncbi:glycosyl transferase family 1 [Cellulomonas chitinilytica]|uniref:Glycosyl transferase family 1 n=1 Tax=Cellulomonas chitinilytica TaxID=398759 RepID=A0A919P270_9CELL|nr:glycosyltransferase [Cellulomonas chitinilytica]GIG20311.1 glycosyl transferase family 1 [Cellulomonas chitinilytica]
MSVRLGVLSTYPSTQCGIATFSAALVTHLLAAGADVGVVRLVDSPEIRVPPVVSQWVAGQVRGSRSAAAALDHYDVAVVQHEYGIYGGPDGQDVLDLVAQVHVPVVTVLHTVLTTPTPNQHRVLAGLVDRSAALVTMTTTARDRLTAGWGVDPARVTVISHGAEDNRSPGVVTPGRPAARPRTVLTWGLLSEGKGIEWALLALAELRRHAPMPTYQVVGQTHPRVLEREGEAYRDRLVALTRDLDLSASVRFDGRYLSGPELRGVVRRADVVLLPYDSREQVTSGVLTEAVAAGKPVVSTRFPHAVELLSSGAGLLVPQRDPSAIAAALVQVLTVDGVAEAMADEARRLADSLLWPAVAEQYLDLAASVQHVALPAAV